MKENEKERFERYKKTLIEIIHDVIPDCKIYLFGSRARRTHQIGADIDIALEANQPIPIDTILKIYGKIEQTTIPLEIDLVDIKCVSEEMEIQIKAEKIQWAA